MVRNTAHFTLLMHPERPAAAHRQRVFDLAEALPPLPGDPLCQSPADLTAAVWAELS